uniref:Zinc finger protein 59-like n=1 Tax=Diabrotica virgifera virgifera TaxID=50390 RepID=A0A6P7F4L0_DIAVI
MIIKKDEEIDKFLSSFTNNVEKDLQSIIHDDQRFYECNVCGNFAHQNKEVFYDHIREHENKKFKCPICKDQFTTFRQAYEHQFSHKKQKPFECDICQEKFHTSYAEKRHKKTHYDWLQRDERLDCVPVPILAQYSPVE